MEGSTTNLGVVVKKFNRNILSIIIDSVCTNKKDLVNGFDDLDEILVDGICIDNKFNGNDEKILISKEEIDNKKCIIFWFQDKDFLFNDSLNVGYLDRLNIFEKRIIAIMEKLLMTNFVEYVFCDNDAEFTDIPMDVLINNGYYALIGYRDVGGEKIIKANRFIDGMTNRV